MSNNAPDYQEDLVFPPEENIRSTKVKRDKIIGYLKALKTVEDEEVAHLWADEALLDYIGDPEITEAFRAVPKYYA